jgi:hypothetical protein
MAEQPRHPYYLQNREKLLAGHRGMAEAARAVAVKRCGGAFADTLLKRESLAELETLVPKAPHVGGKQNPPSDGL